MKHKILKIKKKLINMFSFHVHILIGGSNLILLNIKMLGARVELARDCSQGILSP